MEKSIVPMKEIIDNHKYERELYEKGVKLIAGVDEVGRGPLVGPVVTACVILPVDYHLEGLTDSKKLTPKKREKFYDIIMQDAISVSIGLRDEKVFMKQPKKRCMKPLIIPK